MNFPSGTIRPGSARARRALPALLLALLPLLSPAPSARAQGGGGRKPNIVVFLIDDGAFTDLGTYGGEARTPTIDALAARGAMFASHHTSPLCSPSRAMLLTGIDNHRTGVATIEEVLPPEQEGETAFREAQAVPVCRCGTVHHSPPPSGKLVPISPRALIFLPRFQMRERHPLHYVDK